MKVGIWDNDWGREPTFKRDGVCELVIIDGQEIAVIEPVDDNLFCYASHFGNLFRPDRHSCIVAGLQRDGYTVYE